MARMFQQQPFQRSNTISADDVEFDQEVQLMSHSFGELDFSDTIGTLAISTISTCSLVSNSVPLNSRSEPRFVSSAEKNKVPSLCQSLPLIRARFISRQRLQVDGKKLEPVTTLLQSRELKPSENDKVGSTGPHAIKAFSFLAPQFRHGFKQHLKPLSNTSRSNSLHADSQVDNNSVENVRNEIGSSLPKKCLQQREAMDNDLSSDFSSSGNSIRNFASLVACLIAMMIAINCAIIFKTNRAYLEVSFEKVSDNILSEIERHVHGQHLIIHSLYSSFKKALTDQSIKVITLLLIGPSGCGKSLSRDKVEQVLINNGFEMVRFASDDLSSHLDNACKEPYMSSMSGRKRNLLVILEDSDTSVQSSLKAGDAMMLSKDCSKYEKIIIIVVSTVFSDQIRNFMFENCKLSDNRLKIQYEDVIGYISSNANEGKALQIGGSDKRIKTIPLVFLPLDDYHVRICVQNELARRHIPRDEWSVVVRKVLAQMDFHPQCYMTFSESGCKLVSSRIDFVLGNNI